MIQPGKFNRLPVVKQVSFGVFLHGENAGNILLPKRYVPANTAVGDELEVFLYYDSEDQLIATTERPQVQLGECARLKVRDVNRTGAFLEWGLPKDLLVPFNEQHQPMELGKSYVVTVYRDDQGRLVASSRLNRHLQETARSFKIHQAVELLICGRSDLGYKAVINHTHLGLIFRDDAFKPLRYGARMQGYIKDVRADGKINLCLQLPAGLQRDELCEQIIEHLKASGGVSTLTDKSAPDDIYHQFNVSKANYKKALGRLFKERRIELSQDKVTLLQNDPA